MDLVILLNDREIRNPRADKFEMNDEIHKFPFDISASAASIHRELML